MAIIKVITPSVTDANITLAKLGADSVNATKIADGSIENEHLNVLAITGQTAETSIADGDTILIHDASASALRKMTKANFVSGIGGTNTPAFHAIVTTGQSIGTNTDVELTGFTEKLDTNNAFSSNTFTVPSGLGGTYFFYLNVLFQANVLYPHATFKINSSVTYNSENMHVSAGGTVASSSNTRLITLSAGDTVKAVTFQGSGATNTNSAGRTFFGGYKILT